MWQKVHFFTDQCQLEVIYKIFCHFGIFFWDLRSCAHALFYALSILFNPKNLFKNNFQPFTVFLVLYYSVYKAMYTLLEQVFIKLHVNWSHLTDINFAKFKYKFALLFIDDLRSVHLKIGKYNMCYRYGMTWQMWNHPDGNSISLTLYVMDVRPIWYENILNGV